MPPARFEIGDRVRISGVRSPGVIDRRHYDSSVGDWYYTIRQDNGSRRTWPESWLRSPRARRSRDASSHDARGTRAWEVWSKGDRYDEPGFVEAFKDKGEALARIRRLRRSHPYAHYELRHRRSAARHHFSTRSRRRYAERSRRP